MCSDTWQSDPIIHIIIIMLLISLFVHKVQQPLAVSDKKWNKTKCPHNLNTLLLKFYSDLSTKQSKNHKLQITN